MNARTLFTLVLFGAASVTFAGSEPGEHVDKDGRFKTVFPEKPKLSVNKGRGNLKVYSTSVEGSRSALIVNYFELPDGLPTTDDFVKKGLLNEARGLFSLNKGELKDYKFAKFQKDYWSIEYTGNVGKPYEAHVRARSVLANNRIYNIVIMGNADFLKGESAQKFFDSFQVTK